MTMKNDIHPHGGFLCVPIFCENKLIRQAIATYLLLWTLAIFTLKK